jgi:hypothetical protein
VIVAVPFMRITEQNAGVIPAVVAFVVVVGGAVAGSGVQPDRGVLGPDVVGSGQSSQISAVSMIVTNPCWVRSCLAVPVSVVILLSW